LFNEDIKLLKKEFEKIKKLELVKSLRKGSTGVGFTFETLLNKKEDQESKPDFRSIELKCKMGYSKSPLTLFCCIPERDGLSAIKYIFETYGKNYTRNKIKYKMFSREVFSKQPLKKRGYEFRLKVDYLRLEITLKSYYNGFFVENVCKWNFKTIEKKLKEKIIHLAIIQAYPYIRNQELYYKYVKINFYKLKGYYEFLQLIENDKIFVKFYMKSKSKTDEGKIDNHGVAFRIKNEHIEELFYKIKH